MTPTALNRGAVHILFMDTDGSVKTSTKIADNTNGGPTLTQLMITSAGPSPVWGILDGDGVTDLAVGAFRDDTNGPKSWCGAYPLYEYRWDRKIKYQDCR